MKGMLKEGTQLDRTIALSHEILSIGGQSSQSMYQQSEKLKKTGRNLKRIEQSTLPGIDRMMSLIKNVELRNKLIIAFVIALCLAVWFYSILSGRYTNKTVTTTEE